MRALYKFTWDCGRSGTLDGLFVAESADVEAIMGKDVYFGEVLGKHSEISGTMEPNDITLITDNADVISIFDSEQISSGHNPIEYYKDQLQNEADELKYQEELDGSS